MKWLVGALALMLVLLVWYSLDNRRTMRERIEALEVELDSRVAYVAELEDSLTVKREYVDSVVAKMDTLIAEADDRAQAARDTAREIGGRLHEYVSELDLSQQQKDHLQESILQMEASYRRALFEKDEVIEAQLTQINAMSDELQLTLRVNDELKAALASAEELLDEYRVAVKPGFVGWLTTDVPEKLALVGAGALIGVVAAN